MRSPAAILLLVALPVLADFHEEWIRRWSEWNYARPIERKGTEAAREEIRLLSVVVPREVYARAQRSLADLRIVDDTGAEVPHLLHAFHGRREVRWRDVVAFEPSFVPGRYTQMIVDTGPQPAPHNSLELSTPDTDFFAWAEVAASDDAHNWRILRERLPLYRFREQGHAGNPVLSYPETRSRYLRVRVLLPDKQFAVTGLRVAREIVEEPERVPFDVSFTPQPGALERHSVWVADFGEFVPPVSEIDFTVREAEFHRPVSVFASDDGEFWRTVGSDAVYRIRSDGRISEQLHVRFTETAARYIRVAVFNRDDAPLQEPVLKIAGTPRRIFFRAGPARRYWLLYGNGKARKPEYELARLIPDTELRSAEAAQLGAELLRPGFAGRTDQRPWTERHPLVLWSALGLAVVVLAYLALRALRTA